MGKKKKKKGASGPKKNKKSAFKNPDAAETKKHAGLVRRKKSFAVRSMTVGGSAAIKTTGKGERLSTLLEVMGIISALVLGLAMEGFAGIGQEEFDFIEHEHGTDYMKEQKWRFCCAILAVGVLCIIVLFGIVTLYVFFTHQHKEVQCHEDWVIWLDSFKEKLVFIELLFFCQFLAAGFALSYVATFKLFINKDEDAFMYRFITYATGGSALVVFLFFFYCSWSFGKAVVRIQDRREIVEADKAAKEAADRAAAGELSEESKTDGPTRTRQAANPRLSSLMPNKAAGPTVTGAERVELMQEVMAGTLAAEKVRNLIQGASDCSNLKVLFDTVDGDKDSHISATEFGAFVDGCVAGTPDAEAPEESDITACFNHVDFNANGSIEFDEFQQWLQFSSSQCYSRVRELISGACNMESLETLWKTVDDDDDGCILPAEFAAFVEGCVAGFPGGHDPVVPADVDATFKFIDTNGNGKIEFDEFEYFFFVRKK